MKRQISKTIKQAYESRGETTYSFRKGSGMSHSNYQSIVEGRNYLIDTLLRVADYLGCSFVVHGIVKGDVDLDVIADTLAHHLESDKESYFKGEVIFEVKGEDYDVIADVIYESDYEESGDNVVTPKTWEKKNQKVSILSIYLLSDKEDEPIALPITSEDVEQFFNKKKR